MKNIKLVKKKKVISTSQSSITNFVFFFMQKLARAEILETMGEDNRITTEHMKKMTYLDRCIKESLRLFPTAPHIGRDITEDIRLSN